MFEWPLEVKPSVMCAELCPIPVEFIATSAIATSVTMFEDLVFAVMDSVK